MTEDMGLIPDGQEFERDLVSPTLDRLERQTLPGVIAQIGAERVALEEGLSNVVRGAINGAQAILDAANGDLRTLLESLDGWTLTLEPQGPLKAITGAVVLTLRKSAPRA